MLLWKWGENNEIPRESFFKTLMGWLCHETISTLWKGFAQPYFNNHKVKLLVIWELNPIPSSINTYHNHVGIEFHSHFIFQHWNNESLLIIIFNIFSYLQFFRSLVASITANLSNFHLLFRGLEKWEKKMLFWCEIKCWRRSCLSLPIYKFHSRHPKAIFVVDAGNISSSLTFQ